MRNAILLLALAQVLQGQSSSGSISGQIEDESGGAMPGVAIKAREEKTGFLRSTITGKEGTYRLGELSPGVYSITAERLGFRTAVASHVVIEINQLATLNLRLRVGDAHESIAVNERVSPAQTEDSAVSYRLDSATFTELPLDERRIAALVTLGPGAIPRQLAGFVHDSYNDIQQGSRGSVASNPPINGARSTMNASMLDGAYNTDRNTFATVIAPPMEAVQEFRIQSSLAPVAFAQSGGGVVDVVTKSGGLAFHGSAFEHLRNEFTDARNYFDDPALPRSVFRRNQFGGSLGGPLPLRSSFFFGSYEGLRGKSASPMAQLVPSATLRSGDFRGRNVIYDPISLSASGGRSPFPGNVIPGERIDPIASRYLDLYEPLPNRPDHSSRNYVDTTPSTSDHDLGALRIDHQFRDTGLLFARYIINDERGGVGGRFPLRQTSERLRAQQIVVGHTRGGASWTNEVRASFTRLRLFSVPLSAFQKDVAGELGIPSSSSDPFTFGLPFFFLANFSTVTDDPTLPQVQRDNAWGLSESFSLVRGRRTYRAGVFWTNSQLNYRQSNNVRGRYVYSGSFTGGGAGLPVGDALADFLLGFPQTTQRSVGNSQAYLRQHGYCFFFQQDWRATSNLSLTAGLRYEYYSPYAETRSALLNLDYTGLPFAPKLLSTENAHTPNGLDFSPRAGLAWRLPWLSSRGATVFRAGYGIYYSPEIALESYSLVLNGIRNEMNSSSGFAEPVLTTRNGFPNTPSTGFPSYFGLDRNLPTPYVQQWNAGIQRELPGNVLLEAAYVGSKGVHLGRSRRFNTPLHTETGENLDPRPGVLQTLRTFPELGPIIQFQHVANSSYHSIQIKSEKRFQKSLTFLASFVWSKSIDDASSVVPSLFNSGGAQDERNLRLERALSSFHVGRRVSAGFVYGLPAFNKLNVLLRGWQVSGVITVQDGTPYDPLFVATNTANSGTFTRPSIVPGQKVELSASQRTPERWFNTAAFMTPPPFQFGNSGRNIIQGPGNQLIDLALHRRFPLSERASIEFRAEGFNTFNHPNLGFPDPYPDHGPFFGRVLLSGQPRRLQFASRIDF